MIELNFCVFMILILMFDLKNAVTKMKQSPVQGLIAMQPNVLSLNKA